MAGGILFPGLACPCQVAWTVPDEGEETMHPRYTTLATILLLFLCGLGRADEASAIAAITKLGGRVIQNGIAVDFRHSKVNDEGLKHLLDLKNLHTLHLGAADITDVGMPTIGALSKLRE